MNGDYVSSSDRIQQSFIIPDILGETEEYHEDRSYNFSSQGGKASPVMHIIMRQLYHCAISFITTDVSYWNQDKGYHTLLRL
jgi:hypothetical protein